MASLDETQIFVPINIAIMTVSDTRDLKTDTSGQLLIERLTGDGHKLAERALLKDDVEAIVAKLKQWIADTKVDCIITSGGTGVTGRDVMPEAFGQVCEKEIPGFGELFRWVSLKSIGTSTIQSRATAGVAGGTYLFALPGSSGAVKDGWDEILKFQLDIRHRPCNFVELMPRLSEHINNPKKKPK
ncbi:MAG TPA: molybdenum cofactor biosynthesis protein B [Rhodospirillaceae bacterium]|nr:molybdenum cofactor biosynthesis protein B [Candidatus Neomarinimicrobiota bacterium]HCX14895.1 molybdenum cofactor biosynthesis protein B [Rhodospirillaceae bacterium]|tara:strand:- start:49 stop:606 length:558 start_codon:yes stop_codon:yes gene_type:complete